MFCVGRLIPVEHTTARHGGSALVQVACSGCNVRIEFASSSISATENRRNVVSYALRIASFASYWVCWVS